MKIFQILCLLLITLAVEAQHTISGTFTPAKDYTWVIAYKIEPGTQGYVADTAVNNGKFTLNMPITAVPGTYRLVYAVPQEEFFFDVIYNGRENIQLNFDSKKGVSFSASQENQMYQSYFKEINAEKQRLIDFYAAGKNDTRAFQKLTDQLNATQTSFEENTKGMLAQEFIMANRPYVPAQYEASELYWQNKKAHYFDHLDLKNPVLQASGYLTDKLSGYVFTAITADKRTKNETEQIVQKNIAVVNQKLEGTDPVYQLHILHSLWTKAASHTFDATSDQIFNTYLKPLATRTNNQKIIDDIEVHNRLRLGSPAPEIIWKVGNKEKKLSEMETADCYVLIFWSSTCSHCLKEIPPLHQKLKTLKDIKVLAVGLEDDDTSWKPESAKLPGFEHAIALGKWESPYVKTYAIQQTPTYFILDKDKRIIARPKSDKEVVAFLER